MIKYAIRHKATGLFMPRAKRDRGYSSWKPGTPNVDHTHTEDWMQHQPKDGMYNALPDSVRLLDTRKQAEQCITQWTRGQMEYSYSDGDSYARPRVRKDVPPRCSADLEVVEMILQVKR